MTPPLENVDPLRRKIMSAVRRNNTTPEMIVRRLLHSLGYRYRLHRKDLPGRPDVVFPGRKKVIFVHGCFWHRHPGCSKASSPKTRVEFWQDKFEQNIKRDERVEQALGNMGWKTLTVWECETHDEATLSKTLCGFMNEERNQDAD